MLHSPQTPACTFALGALTSSPGIFYETLMHHATRSGSPHNALVNTCNIICQSEPDEVPTTLRATLIKVSFT